MEEVKACTAQCHNYSGSIHPKNAVPIELFTKDGKTLKHCQDCRNYRNKVSQRYFQKKKGKPNTKPRKIIEDALKFMKCPGKGHTSDFEHPKRKVPIDLFRKEPGNSKSELFKRCKECRMKESAKSRKKVAEKKKIAKEKGLFHCAGCEKEYARKNMSLNKDGSISSRCINCKDVQKTHNKKLRESYNKVKKEMIMKHQCSCQKCKCIYLKNGDGVLCLETFKNIEKYVKYKGKTYRVVDFLKKHSDDLELTIIELDHLNEEEQIERGILKPNERFVPKKDRVSHLGSETSMRLEALKTQNLCIKCHLEETIKREGNKIDSKFTKAERVKRKFVDKQKKKFGGCSICKYVNNDLLRFFHMDHINPENKVRDISHMIKTAMYTIEDIEKELKKCRMLCAHCHAIHTQKQHNEGVILEKKLNNKKVVEKVYVEVIFVD